MLSRWVERLRISNLLGERLYMVQESLEEGESLSEAHASERESVPNQERLFQLAWIEFPETGSEQWVGRTLALLLKGNSTSLN